MKKSILILFCFMCLTGCTKKITCTKENKTKEYTINLKSVYSYKKNNLKEIYKSSTIEFKNEEEAKEYYDQYKETAEFNKEYGSEEEIKAIEKNKISLNKKKFIIETTYSNQDIKEEAKTNEEFLNRMEYFLAKFK